MPYYRPLTYRGYYDYPDRHPYPIYHPYDSLFYGSRWYDYPPSLYGLDYTYRLPSISGINRNWYRGAPEYGYSSHPSGYSPSDPYGLTEPRYHMLFNDELKSLPKYSKYNKYPLYQYQEEGQMPACAATPENSFAGGDNKDVLLDGMQKSVIVFP